MSTIVANQAQTGRMMSGVIPASAFALELGENQISPFFLRELGLFGIWSHAAYVHAFEGG